MACKMQVNRLNKEELTYELRVRGIAIGTVEEMRHALSMARKLEASGGSVRYPAYPYTVEEDVKAVLDKLEELEPLITNFNDPSSSNSFCIYQTKLIHVLNRVDNMDEEATQRPELRAKALTLLDALHRKAEEFEKTQNIPPQLSLLEPAPFDAPIDRMRRSSSISPNRSSNVVKPILPNKWNLKFSGDKKGLSLSAFLERVEELRIARHVGKETLLESGIDLFGGRAYQFYVAYRSQVSTWDEFVTLLREEFLSPNYNEKLFEELRKRTQGPEESIGIYLAVMTGYFNRLTCHVSEETKLKIVLRNIAPFYQNQLALVEVKSISQLRELGRRLEARKEAVEEYVAPSRRHCTLEPDLAYLQLGENMVDTCEASTSGQQSAGRFPDKEIICYRCNKPGHRALQERRFHSEDLPRLLQEGKRPPTHLDNRGRRVGKDSTIDKFQVILDYVLGHAVNDERPYIQVDILGRTISGLLDSGASRTVIGGKGLTVIRELQLRIDRSRTSVCTVANGNSCQIMGTVELPVSLRGRFRLIEAIVVPELPHLLILGIDFWRIMGIVPDLRRDEWFFSNEPVSVTSLEHVNSQMQLSSLQEARLQAVIDNNLQLMGTDFMQKGILEAEDGTQSSGLSRNEAFRQMFSDVQKRLEIAAKKSCDRYNLRRRHVEYFPHQLKLAPKFIGPFVIKKKVSPWTYELADDGGNSKGVWHIKNLKSCPDEDEPENE
ncbi:hypothetical protein NQ317_004103 [Molorchus minor]|uniref:Peptidase A2 domain-containing protein n=1 Tax=Molorchus minor TaxID=1323400 RepID=A0ABQ9IYP2_9CUCU|nr:hypothetical protein NQ317_004103 [Molorchus minor]